MSGFYNVGISDDIINYAKEKNVSIYQRVTFETGSNSTQPRNKDDKLKTTATFPLFQATNKANDATLNELLKNTLIKVNAGQSGSGSAVDVDYSKK